MENVMPNMHCLWMDL